METLDCRLCSHCLKTMAKEKNEYAEAQGLIGMDYYCRHPEGDIKTIDGGRGLKYPLIQGSRYTDYAVTQPDWCPMKRNLFKLNNQDTKMPEQQQRSKRTYREQCEEYEKILAPTKWEELKEGEIYHYPPVYSEKRCDYFVTRKTEFYICARKLENNNTSLGDLSYFYKSDNKYKFLKRHRILKFDTKLLKEKSVYPYY